MSVLGPADLRRPENFHKITRHRLVEIIEVFSKIQVMKQSRCSRPVGVPAAPDSLAVALIANDQLLEGGDVETRSRPRPALLQSSS